MSQIECKNVLFRYLRGLMIAPMALTVLMACEPTVAADGEQADGEQEGLLAEVGSVQITEQEMEEQLSAELQRLERERYDLMSQGVEKAIERALLDLEAEARGVSSGDLLASLYQSLGEPSDEAVTAFYESQKTQINRPIEDVRAQIVNYLKQQDRQAAFRDLISDVKGRYEVRRYLEPMRMEIAAGDSPSMGPDDATVTIIEFSDFQCPYCQRLAPTLTKIVEDYDDRVRLVFRQFPLRQLHADAEKAAEASLCAAEEDKFWQMHDAMFENYRSLPVDQLKAIAAGLGLDAASFAECLDSGRYSLQVAEDVKAGQQAGVSGTPAIFINGRFLSGAQPYEVITAVIEDELDRAKQGGN
jgi:protein-disulfide isomerase